LKKVNLSQIPVEIYRSPKGKFGIHYRDTSRKLGRRGVPFELEHVTVKPGKVNFPYHLHSTEWEMYVIIRGTGQIRLPSGKQRIRVGDVLLCPPNEPHQIINNSRRDLEYYVIANNAGTDLCYYPDSKKWMLPGKCVTVRKANYHDGEE
jgi:uncharacterized cupin superfamily protein